MKNKFLSIMVATLLFFFSFALCACGETYQKYDVSAYVFGARYGDVVGGNDTYLEGTRVTIKAIPKNTLSQTPNKFICWVHDDKVVSTEAEYSFIVNLKNAGIYIALFECPDLEYVSLGSIDFDYGTNDYSGDTSLTEFTLKLGYNERETSIVYSLDEDTIGKLSQPIQKEDIYEADDLPFAFDKTEDLYAVVELTYTRGDLIYTSTTTIKINAIEVGTDMAKVENKELNAPSLSGGMSYLEFTENPSISFSFEKLTNLIVQESEEDEE